MTGQSSTDRDGQIIAGQEREIARLRAALAAEEEQNTETWNDVAEWFNPPDSDTWHPSHSIEEAAAFIAAQPCICTPEQIEDFDACARCKVLGRRGDEAIGR